MTEKSTDDDDDGWNDNYDGDDGNFDDNDDKNYQKTRKYYDWGLRLPVTALVLSAHGQRAGWITTL